MTIFKDRHTSWLSPGDNVFPIAFEGKSLPPVCRAPEPDTTTDWPALCTRPTDHELNHAAFDYNGRVHAAWGDGEAARVLVRTRLLAWFPWLRPLPPTTGATQ